MWGEGGEGRGRGALLVRIYSLVQVKILSAEISQSYTHEEPPPQLSKLHFRNLANAGDMIQIGYSLRYQVRHFLGPVNV